MAEQTVQSLIHVHDQSDSSAWLAHGLCSAVVLGPDGKLLTPAAQASESLVQNIPFASVMHDLVNSTAFNEVRLRGPFRSTRIIVTNTRFFILGQTSPSMDREDLARRVASATERISSKSRLHRRIQNAGSLIRGEIGDLVDSVVTDKLVDVGDAWLTKLVNGENPGDEPLPSARFLSAAFPLECLKVIGLSAETAEAGPTLTVLLQETNAEHRLQFLLPKGVDRSTIFRSLGQSVYSAMFTTMTSPADVERIRKVKSDGIPTVTAATVAVSFLGCRDLTEVLHASTGAPPAEGDG
jgi:hypothetical protein